MVKGNYQNAKIYSIRSYQTDIIYIGSTIKTLSSRLASHKYDYKKYLEGKQHFISSYQLLKFDDVYIELIENFPCSCKDELTKREGYYIRESKICVNKQIPNRTDKEYYEDNKKKIAEQGKIYRENNKEKIFERRKKYRQVNADKIKSNKYKQILCECGTTYTHTHKSRHEKSIKHQNFMNKCNLEEIVK